MVESIIQWSFEWLLYLTWLSQPVQLYQTGSLSHGRSAYP